MTKILLLCYGCGITLEPGTTACDNCGADKDLDKKSWIKATMTDEEAGRLEAVANFVLDYAPEPPPPSRSLAKASTILGKTLLRPPMKGGKRK